jgi:hypothetical protein
MSADVPENPSARAPRGKLLMMMLLQILITN